MPKVKVGDIEMYYEVHGAGKPLVMICGASATTESYRMLVPQFARRYQVVLFDNRGVGQGDNPDIPYTIQMMADDLAGLMDSTGFPTAHVYGQSMGGMIAQQFAISYPQKVQKLILQCTTCGGPHAVGLKPSKRFDPEIRTKMTPEELGQETLRLCVTQGFIDAHPEIAQIMLKAIARQSEPAYGALRQAQAARGFNSYDRLPEIKAPTLVLGGEADEAVAVENSRLIASRIAGSELVTFLGAGHILIEVGNKPVEIVLEFLGRG